MNDLSIIILNYNTKDLTLKCLESIFEKKWKHSIRVILVDNASTDQSVRAFRKLDYSKNNIKFEIIENRENYGFSKGNNTALKRESSFSRYCLMLNSDTVVTNNSLDILIDFMDESDFSIGSCKLLNQDHTLQPNAGSLPKIFPLFTWLSGLDDLSRKFIRVPSYHEMRRDYYKGEREVGWVSGSVMIIKSNIFKKLGYLDEKIFMYCEDVDFCFRANQLGLKIGWSDKASIYHLGGASSINPKKNQWEGEFKGLIYLYNKYYGKAAGRILKLFILFFVYLRIVGFYILGKADYAKTYAKIAKTI